MSLSSPFLAPSVQVGEASASGAIASEVSDNASGSASDTSGVELSAASGFEASCTSDLGASVASEGASGVVPPSAPPVPGFGGSSDGEEEQAVREATSRVSVACSRIRVAFMGMPVPWGWGTISWL
jgi:hypothetical protein